MIQWLYDKFIDPEQIGPGWFVWAGASIVFFWVVFWWSMGMFPTEAFGAGFAVAEKVERIEARIIEGEVIETASRRCQAVTPQAHAFFAERITEKQRDYYELTGTTLNIPTCADLGLVKPA